MALAATMDVNVFSQAPAGVLNVLLERYKQILMVAIANQEAGNPRVTALPSGLSPDQQSIGVALLLLHGMDLLWPPGGPYPDE